MKCEKYEIDFDDVRRKMFQAKYNFKNIENTLNIAQEVGILSLICRNIINLI